MREGRFVGRVGLKSWPRGSRLKESRLKGVKTQEQVSYYIVVLIVVLPVVVVFDGKMEMKSQLGMVCSLCNVIFSIVMARSRWQTNTQHGIINYYQSTTSLRNTIVYQLILTPRKLFYFFVLHHHERQVVG